MLRATRPLAIERVEAAPVKTAAGPVMVELALGNGMADTCEGAAGRPEAVKMALVASPHAREEVIDRRGAADDRRRAGGVERRGGHVRAGRAAVPIVTRHDGTGAGQKNSSDTGGLHCGRDGWKWAE